MSGVVNGQVGGAHLRLDLGLDLLEDGKRGASVRARGKGQGARRMDGFEWHAGRAIGRIVSLPRQNNGRQTLSLATGEMQGLSRGVAH